MILTSLVIVEQVYFSSFPPFAFLSPYLVPLPIQTLWFQTICIEMTCFLNIYQPLFMVKPGLSQRVLFFLLSAALACDEFSENMIRPMFGSQG